MYMQAPPHLLLLLLPLPLLLCLSQLRLCQLLLHRFLPLCFPLLSLCKGLHNLHLLPVLSL